MGWLKLSIDHTEALRAQHQADTSYQDVNTCPHTVTTRHTGWGAWEPRIRAHHSSVRAPQFISVSNFQV